MGMGEGDAAFSGSWMDQDGAVIVVKGAQITWPDGTVSTIAVKDTETLQLMYGGDVLEGKVSADGAWLVWNDGDTWVRLLADMGARMEQGSLNAIGLDDDDDDDDEDDDDEDDEDIKVDDTQPLMFKPPVREAGEEKALKEDSSTNDSEVAAATAPEAQGPQEPAAGGEGKAEEEDPDLAERLLRQREEEEEEQRYRQEEEELMQRWDEWEVETAAKLIQPETTEVAQAPGPAVEAPQPGQPTAAETPAAPPVAAVEAPRPVAVEAPPPVAVEAPPPGAVEAPQPAAEAHQEGGAVPQPEEEAALCQPGASGPAVSGISDTAEVAPLEGGELATTQAGTEEGQREEEEEEEPRQVKQPCKPARPIEDPFSVDHRLERTTAEPPTLESSTLRASGPTITCTTLESPMPSVFPHVYPRQLEYKVVAPHIFLRKAASTAAPRVALLQEADVIKGYQQGQWLHTRKNNNAGWVFIDGVNPSPDKGFEHKYLKLRVQRTFAGAVLLEWDRLDNAKFVDYAIQWSPKSDPETVTTAASHIPRVFAKIEGLPSEVQLKLRVVACVYTDTRSNGGERFAGLVGDWVEAKTVDDPTVEALEQPMPEKMRDVYAAPLTYTVNWQQVVIRTWPSTRAKPHGTLPRGKKVSGYQQGNWISLTKPCSGWMLVNGERLGCGQLVGHDYLECRILRSYSEAMMVEWDALEGAKIVDYTLEWAETTSGPFYVGNENLPRTVGCLQGLPADEKFLIRVCAKVYTQTKGNGGFHFATVCGPWASAETEAAITEIEEGSLCLDPMANLRGRCMDCACKGLVGVQLEPELRRKGWTEEDVVCKRCGCGCMRHMIIGEYHHRKTAGSNVASAFKLPARILKEAEREAREAQQAQKALTNDAGSGPKPPPPGKLEIKVWCPEDSGLDGDRVGFVLDKIAQARTLYETLGVKPDCEDKEIRHAHRRISLYVHPDKVLNRNDQELVKQAEAAFKIVSAAYEVLGDPLKRGSYDQSIRSSGYVAYTSSTSSTRKDLSVATLLRRFLSKATWGWDLHARPPGDWEEFGKGVYGIARNASLTVLHAITKEELVMTMDRGISLNTVKHCIVTRVKRGPSSAIELATVEGEVLQDDFRIPQSLTLILAGISSLGPAKDVRLCLSHAHTGARHYVVVPDTSTMAMVRELAAQSLQVSPRELRLGYRFNNTEKLKDFEDTDFLNGRTHILVLGVKIPIDLSIEEATELQSELIVAYKDDSFQRELDQLLAQHPPPDGLLNPDFKERWSYLLRHAQKNILLKHGFDGPHGAVTMLAAFGGVNYHPEVVRLGAEIDVLLRVTVGTALVPVIGVQVQPADEDLSGDAGLLRGIKVVVPVGSTIGDLKEGIAKRLNEDAQKIEVVTLGKSAVPRKDNIIVHDEDSEVVGRRQKFHVRGITMPPQDVLDKALKEQVRATKRAAAERLRAKKAQDEIAAWEAIKDCTGCDSKLPTARGHISNDDQKWYCNHCWIKHSQEDNRQIPARAIAAVDTIMAKEGGIDKVTRKCTTPDCKYLMNRNARLGASVFCCLQCKEGRGHGYTCERRELSSANSPEPEPLSDEEPPKQVKQKEIKQPATPEVVSPPPEPKKLPEKAPDPAPVRETAVAPRPVVEAPEPPKPKVPAKPEFALVPMKEEPLDVTIDVKSCNQQTANTWLKVKATLKWIDVKRALARKVGRPAILREGKLASKTDDGGYCSLMDTKVIQESQEVFLFNTDLSYNVNCWDYNEDDYRKAEKERQQAGATTEKKAAPPDSKESLLTLKDLRTAESFDLKILKTMTAIEVKDVIAWALKKPEEEVRAAKLLKRGAEGYLSIPDAEAAGHHRTLWMMNTSITPVKGCPAARYLQLGQPVVCKAVADERAAAAAAATEEASLLKLQDAPKNPEWVLVGITHAMKKDESIVEVLVLDNCLLSNCLQALSQRLNSDQVLSQGKFVERRGASYRNLKLEEPLKQRRELLFMGPNLKRL